MVLEFEIWRLISFIDDHFGPQWRLLEAKHHWTAPRTVRLKKREHEGYGFSVRGDAPVIIAGVDIGSIAEVRNY